MGLEIKSNDIGAGENVHGLPREKAAARDAEVAKAADAFGATKVLDTHDLLPGDVIFTLSKNTSKVHGLVTLGQRIQKFVMKLLGFDTSSMEARFAHVSIYTADHKDLRGLRTQDHFESLPGSGQEHLQTETTQIRRPTAKNMPLGSGTHVVIRPRDTNIGRQMASLGQAWVDSGKTIAYNHSGSIWSVFRRSFFGKQGEAQYKQIVQDAKSKDPVFLTTNGSFCSDMPVNVINGAHSLENPGTDKPLLAVHAANTSPMELAALLKKSTFFDVIGQVHVDRPTYRTLDELQNPKLHAQLIHKLNEELTQPAALATIAKLSPATLAAVKPRLNTQLQQAIQSATI